MSFDDSVANEREQHLMACIHAIAKAGMFNDYRERSIAMGIAFLKTVEDTFDGPERVVFLTLLAEFIEEMLQEESDLAWEHFAHAMIEDQIGDESCR